MVSLLNISAVVAVTPLMSLVFMYPAILSHLASNSIIVLILLVSLYSVFTAQTHRSQTASVVALAVAPFLTVLYQVLTLVPPAVVRTLLSNFTFAAVPLSLVSYVSQLLLGVIYGLTVFFCTYVIGVIYGAIAVKKWEQERRETRPTLESRIESVKRRIEKWGTENEEVNGLLFLLGTQFASAFMTSMIQYAVLGYYTVMIPPLVSADSTARVGPYEVLTYALVIALGIHATSTKLWQILPSEVRSRTHEIGDSVSLQCAAFWFAELLISLIATAWMALRYVEISLLRESASMLWPFFMTVFLTGGYKSVLLIAFSDQVPGLGKMVVVGLFSWLSVSYGLSSWSGFCDASTGIDQLAAMM